MKAFEYTIKDEIGIHARPAGLLVNKAKALGCTVTLEKDGKRADASRLFAVMGLGVKHGDTLRIILEGGDEDAAARELLAFFEENL